MDAFALELGEYKTQAAVDVMNLIMREAAYGFHLAAWRQTADVVMVDAALEQMLEAGHANHEELIEVGAGDGDEAKAFQQRILLAQ